MKILLGIFLICSFVLSLNSCHSPPSELGIHLKLVKKTLKNGLNVILVEDHSIPVISYQTWFRVGSVDEYPGITGISHMFEHLLFKGTPRFAAREFIQILESQGAEVNAYTTRDYTVFYETIAPSLLNQVVEMESDRLGNLTLNDQVLKNEQMIVFEERRLRTDHSPEMTMQEALWQLAYRRHPYQWPVIGIPSDIIRITTPILVDYYKTYFQPANASLVIVGDFQTEPLWELIKKSYSNIPSKEKPGRNFNEEPEQTEERRLTMRGAVVGERFAQGYHITSAQDTDSYALDVLANILFEGSTSRAYRRLVDQKGLAITLNGSAYTPAFPGLFMVSAILKEGVKSEVAESELDKVIDSVQAEGVTEKELQVAVKQLTVQVIDSVRTPHGLGQLIGTVQTLFDKPERFAGDLSNYSKVTIEDVKRVAVKYLNPNNRSVVNLVPAK